MNTLSFEEIKNGFEKENYIADNQTIYAVYTALMLGKPLLIDGPAGIGKTELAKVMSKVLDTELIRLQCYEGIDYTKVLYDINYPKQLLYQNILKSNLNEIIAEKDFDEAVKTIDRETNFYGEGFIMERPILKALTPRGDKGVVALIDEIDKTDGETEALLLEPLSDYTLSIPEFGTIECREEVRPFVVLTSNGQREISEALRRRCVYLFIDYPKAEMESKIIAKKANVSVDFANYIARTLQTIRNKNIKQKPSIAESVEWATVLYHHLGICNEDDFKNKQLEEKLESSLNTLIKNNRDLQEVRKVIKGI